MPTLQFSFKAIKNKCVQPHVLRYYYAVRAQCKFPKIAASSSSKILHCLPKPNQTALSRCKLRLHPPQLSLLCQPRCHIGFPEGLKNMQPLNHALNSGSIHPCSSKGVALAPLCTDDLDSHLPSLPGFFYTAALAWLNQCYLSLSSFVAINVSTLGPLFIPH